MSQVRTKERQVRRDNPRDLETLDLDFASGTSKLNEAFSSLARCL